MEHFEKDVMEFIATRIENFYTNNHAAVKLLCSYSDALLNREILLTNKIYSLGYTDALSIIGKGSLLL
ncbi:hypothetical protein HCJ82_13755 [Listeria booriae]|uniref:hypothetical protein n=1 Tax=Listeria booriae TaxID=1552123 RepID=UPI00162544E2|nr:hypothetical protein [Listeria booriae]MBC2181233.1 hypothetical protein [Listeria booriae]